MVALLREQKHRKDKGTTGEHAEEKCQKMNLFYHIPNSHGRQLQTEILLVAFLKKTSAKG